ncbi:MAG: metallophosphoesterase [Phycisphaerae bacterium]|nr:metallophosphoesterase [Phycisphaerae bacterium]
MNEVLLPPPAQRWPSKAFFKKLIWAAANSCALGGLYVWSLEKHWLRIERRPMALPDLGAGFCGAKLAHVSDLHCSPIVRQRYLRQCVEAINAEGADFVAITGDFVTGPRSYARRIAGILAGLTPKVAVLACLGNHDYGIFHPHGRGGTRELAETLCHELGHADIFVMMNERRVFEHGGASLQFVGVEDYWTPGYDPKLAFDMAHPHLPTIALCHNPDAALELARHGADWVLAGHTHGTAASSRRLSGLFMPTVHKHFTAGQYPLGDGKYLYVNRGLSYARRRHLNARPEITIFTLTRA